MAFGDHGDHVFAAQPPLQERPRQPVRARVQLRVRPLLLAVHGRHRVRMRPYPLLEQFVRPCVRQRTAWPGQPLQLLAHLVGRQQALPCVLGVHVGRQQPKGRQVVAGDPGRTRSVQHVRAVAQPQPEPAVPVGPAHVQNTLVGRGVLGPAGTEHDLVRRLPGAQFPAQFVHRELPVRQHVRLGVPGDRHQRAPGARGNGQAARQRLAPHPGGVTRHHLRLTGQRGQHLGVCRQQQGADRYSEPPHQPAHRLRHVVRHRCLVLGRSRSRVPDPPRHRGGTAVGQYPAPELPVRFHARSHRLAFLNSRSRHWCRPKTVTLPGRCPRPVRRRPACPRPGCRPTVRTGGLPRPS